MVNIGKRIEPFNVRCNAYDEFKRKYNSNLYHPIGIALDNEIIDRVWMNIHDKSEPDNA